MQKVRETLENLQQVSLLDEEHLLRVLIDHMPDFIYVKDTRSKFIVANKKFAQVHHLKSPQDMIGKSDHDLYPGELADKFYRDEQEIMASGRPMINFEEKSIDEKGDEIYQSSTKIPLQDKNGKVIGLAGIGRDITHLIRAEEKLVERSEELEHVNKLLEEKKEEVQQQAEELLAQTESLIHANLELEKLTIAVSETDNVVIILDAEGNFEWVNKSFTRIYGMTLEQWTKEKGRNILTGSYNPHINDIFHKCRDSGKTVSYQSEAQNKDGETIWTQSTLTPLLDPDDNILRFVSIDSDITALKRAQELINEQSKELESQRDQLEKANITKDKFFSIIAHDLKNPFHSILGFTDMLTKNFTEIEDDKKLEYLGMVHESAQYAHDLLENLLNWSRAQSGTIKYIPDSFDLHSMVEEIQHIMYANLGKKKLNFQNRISKGSLVYADRNMIHTVLRNLISNAIKYTPNEGNIMVEAKTAGDKLEISVKDTGMGIPETHQKKLLNLDEFHTTAGTAGEQGTGLGLIICNDFIKKHGGNLKVDSNPGKGSTFQFDLTIHKT